MGSKRIYPTEQWRDSPKELERKSDSFLSFFLSSLPLHLECCLIPPTPLSESFPSLRLACSLIDLLILLFSHRSYIFFRLKPLGGSSHDVVVVFLFSSLSRPRSCKSFPPLFFPASAAAALFLRFPHFACLCVALYSLFSPLSLMRYLWDLRSLPRSFCLSLSPHFITPYYFLISLPLSTSSIHRLSNLRAIGRQNTDK